MLRDLVAKVDQGVVMVHCLDFGSKGPGFFVDSDGHVVTNAHVVSQPQFDEQGTLTYSYSADINVIFEGSPHKAELVTDQETYPPIVYDYAILKVEGITNAPHLEVADPGTTVQRGDEVVCLGFPLDFRNLIATKGIICTLLRRPSPYNTLHQISTIVSDALIQYGSSGGPMLHVDSGRVIGINTSKHELHDILKEQLRRWLDRPDTANWPLVRDLVRYTLRYTHVGLNHAISVQHVRDDPDWPVEDRRA